MINLKKIIPILFIITILIGFNNKEELLIPKQAIRFRVIANSNSFKDQEQKLKVKTLVENKLDYLMLNVKNYQEAEEQIAKLLPEIRKIVNEISPQNEVSFGTNYFPEKEYHGLTYPNGEYKSLVITLGSAEGQNWWCVMYPPLCLLEKKDNLDNVEYKSLVKEIINKYQA